MQEGEEILYVGCGSGVAAIQIAMEYDCRVVGVDLLETMVESAREWAERRRAVDRTEFRVADAQDLPFEHDRFDVLICESVNTFVPDLEARAQFGFHGFWDYMRILGRFFSTFLFDPATRKLMRLVISEPRAIFDYMGYGLYAGQKPGNRELN